MKGSIRLKGPDRWQIRVCLGRDPETDRYRYVHREVHGGKRVAQRAAAELVVEVEHGGHQHSGPHTLTELLERWMAHIEAQGTVDPVPLPVSHQPQHPPPTGDRAHRPPDRCRSGRLLRPPGQGRPRAAQRPQVPRHPVRRPQPGDKWGWIDRNPTQRSSPPGVRSREIVPPTAGEVRRLLEGCEAVNPDLASLIYTAVTTGCRRGELCGLRWGDVDLDGSTVVIVRSISDAGRAIQVKDTKTHQARRLALDPSTVEVLRRHLGRTEERAHLAGVSLGPSAYVWSQDLAAAAPYRPDRVTGAFRALTHRLDLAHVTFHSLRHFSATALAGQGVGVRTIAGRLGHANPSLTLRTYAHFLDVADREAAAAIGEVVAGLMAPPASVSSASS